MGIVFHGAHREELVLSPRSSRYSFLMALPRRKRQSFNAAACGDIADACGDMADACGDMADAGQVSGVPSEVLARIEIACAASIE
jgi:hypothetical protein